jgi:very-short-patch-repair endonuclease
MKVYYNPELKQKARNLRNNVTFSERVLWKYLKSSQMKGYRFTRQKPIGNYIVDFYCSKLQLIIEVDGDSHNEKQEYDRKRQKELEDKGFHFLRFDGYTVINQTESVLTVIADKIEELQGQPPNPLY